MARRTHKSTDKLSAEARRVMFAGFASGMTYAAIAEQLWSMGVKIPERTVARRGAEWHEEQERRKAAREQVAAIMEAMKEGRWESSEILRALATDALLNDPEAFAGADPMKVQDRNLAAEDLRLKREKLELQKAKHDLNVAKFRALQEREQRAIAALEKPADRMTPEDRLREIRAIYGIKEANA
jgi:hypothetical protein